MPKESNNLGIFIGAIPVLAGAERFIEKWYRKLARSNYALEERFGSQEDRKIESEMSRLGTKIIPGRGVGTPFGCPEVGLPRHLAAPERNLEYERESEAARATFLDSFWALMPPNRAPKPFRNRS